MPAAYGHAIVATGNQNCSGNQYGTIFGGSSKVNIVGGGVFSNGCMNGNGADFEVRVIGGTIMYAGELEAGNGDWYQNGSPDLPDKAAMPLPQETTYISPPNCADPKAHVITTLRESDFPLEAGLWCVTGTANIKINGGDIIGEGVTIYFEHADVEIDGGKANVQLSAPDNLPDPSPAVPGLLFYLAEGDLDMTGNNTSRFQGTVYAPNGEIKAHGTAGMKPTFNTQLIGEHVDVSGNYDLDIVYDQGKAYSIPTGIELNR
jgi:hypothetical protein